MINIDEKNIVMNLVADNASDAISKLVDVMVENDYVKRDYYLEVMEREDAFPTGLPTGEIKVAIPHAESDKVLKYGVAIGILESPVEFSNMADPNDRFPVDIVFLIANKRDGMHLKTLQVFMACFSEELLLDGIKKASEAKMVKHLLEEFMQSEITEETS